jgi:hypothetical protein
MKRKLHQKLRINVETLRILNLGGVKGGGTPQTRAFTNCAYCITTPADCPTFENCGGDGGGGGGGGFTTGVPYTY